MSVPWLRRQFSVSSKTLSKHLASRDGCSPCRCRCLWAHQAIATKNQCWTKIYLHSHWQPVSHSSLCTRALSLRTAFELEPRNRELEARLDDQAPSSCGQWSGMHFEGVESGETSLIAPSFCWDFA